MGAADYAKAIHEAALEGFTLRQIGDAMGISYERVRQVARDQYGEEFQHDVQAARNVRLRELLEIYAVEFLAECPPCAVCGGPNPREGRRTCSGVCAKAWSQTNVRYRLNAADRDRHRVQLARSILAHPEGKRSSQIDWANRMLSDDPPAPNRTFTVPNSKTSQQLAVIGLSPDAKDEAS